MKLQELIEQIHEVFEGEPWYGNSISTYLQEIKPEYLDNQLQGSHTIGQIIAHMITWREFVIDKLRGKANTIEVGSAEDWDRKSYTQVDKNELFIRFKTTQKALIQLLQEKDDAILTQTVPGKSYAFEKLLTGIIQHDIYHLGQIYLLKSACS